MFSQKKKETPPCLPPPHHGVNHGGGQHGISHVVHPTMVSTTGRGNNMGFLMFTWSEEIKNKTSCSFKCTLNPSPPLYFPYYRDAGSNISPSACEAEATSSSGVLSTISNTVLCFQFPDQ